MTNKEYKDRMYELDGFLCNVRSMNAVNPRAAMESVLNEERGCVRVVTSGLGVCVISISGAIEFTDKQPPLISIFENNQKDFDSLFTDYALTGGNAIVEYRPARLPLIGVLAEYSARPEWKRIEGGKGNELNK
jgi:hypothetical protein